MPINKILAQELAVRVNQINAAVAKWNIAWVMENPHLLKQPVKYAHPNGAVKWVKLEDDVQRAIGSQFC